MKKIIFFAIMIIFLMCCSNPSKSELDDCFAIYLLKNDTLDYHDVIDIGMQNVELENSPLVSSENIAYYDLETENFYLKHLPELSSLNERENFFQHAGDVPFVFVINTRRYFIGSHVGMACSHIFAGPRLDYFLDSTVGMSVIRITFSEEDKYLKEAPKYQAILNKFSK